MKKYFQNVLFLKNKINMIVKKKINKSVAVRLLEN